MSASVIDVVEAAYDLECEEQRWLDGVVRAARPKLDRGPGLVSFLYRVAGDGRLRPGTASNVGVSEAVAAAVMTAVPHFPPEYVAATFLRDPCTSARTTGSRRVQEYTRAEMRRLVGPAGWRDLFVINGLDPTGFGVYLGAPLPRVTNVGAARRTSWGRVAVHLAAGYRLRRRLSPAERAQPESAEAIVTPDGRIEHATAAARPVEARARLRQAARVIDRARGPLRRRDPERAVAEWKGLIAARWTLVDHFESDGRRYLLARRNDVAARDRFEALTARERQALAFAALGHTNKMIAYEMGISPATVGVLLHRAAVKLGTRSRSELVASFARFAFTPPS